ncbi:hypothetical protein GALMADRAFT_1049899 [Galerina marginata CBS 339.88]|uniref:Uncharacterized protein n=1 Tax=Galerina marginata (strain CBS 339.88) TaxID=685588 RepID=A0A067SE72_GALM3|nr:hypothetical protein GALMADRAFT_1049899 [Galerina marginata CBS 339.88]
MRAPLRLCVAIALLLLKYPTQVLAYTLSVPSLKVAVGQTFPLSWTSMSDDLENVDVCLNDINNIQFLRIGSIQRSNALEGKVDVTVNKTIVPGTYTLGIRFPGCAFLFAQDFNDFVVTAPAPPSTTPPQTSQSQTSSASSPPPPPPPPPPPHTSSSTSHTSATPTTSSSTSRATSAGSTHTESNSVIKTGSAVSIRTIPIQSTTPTATSPPDGSTTQIPSSGALGMSITEFSLWGKGMVEFCGFVFGVLVVFL